MVDYNKKPELVIGLVAPVGVNLNSVQDVIKDYLSHFKYTTNHIKISNEIKNISFLTTQIVEAPEHARINSYMDAGNEAREKTKRGDFLAALAISKIYKKRKKTPHPAPLPGIAHIVNSLKHPEEVQLLRSTYGDGFYLLGVTSSVSNRKKYLSEQKNIPEKEALNLFDRDKSEGSEFGQHMRDTFSLADGFVDIDSDNANDQIKRILYLIFGHPYITPTKDEYAMFLAFASSLRSGDLSRQIGAVITTPFGEIISTGANDVPRAFGGLYWADDKEKDHRDYKLGHDANEKRRNEIAVAIMKKILPEGTSQEELLKKGKEVLKDTGIYDITEYGRSVHAEMEALMSCARVGVSPRKGTVYTTTFPCHNCAKHIVAAGIERVVFVEPYPKSLAIDLHPDSIVIANEVNPREYEGKVKFEPFAGVGPRRFMDLFSMTLSSGNKIQRKKEGEIINWEPESACVRVPLMPMTYIERETYLSAEIGKLVNQIIGEKDGSKG